MIEDRRYADAEKREKIKLAKKTKEEETRSKLMQRVLAKSERIGAASAYDGASSSNLGS